MTNYNKKLINYAVSQSFTKSSVAWTVNFSKRRLQLIYLFFELETKAKSKKAY